MFLESFQHFKELDSLSKKILEHTSAISSENKRISDLVTLRQNSSDKIQKLSLDVSALKLKELELEISSLSSLHKKLNSQLSLVKSEKELSSLTNEISHTKKKLDDNESLYFSHLEDSEIKNQEIDDCKTFLQGSELTLNEIQSEVDKHIKDHQIKIDNLNDRIDSLLHLLPDLSRKLYIETQKKFKDQSPFAFVQIKSCSKCKITIDSISVRNVESGVALELCPNCGRILLPM